MGNPHALTDPARIARRAAGGDRRSSSLLVGCLQTLLGRVPAGYRQALELTDLGELTEEQAAVQLGLTTSGMKSHLQRGRRLLRAEITHCCQVSLDSQGGVADVVVRPEERACLPLV
jgi:DNA-directed RNA polymerase specialized sigma24 family protein